MPFFEDVDSVLTSCGGSSTLCPIQQEETTRDSTRTDAVPVASELPTAPVLRRAADVPDEPPLARLASELVSHLETA
jgi:hypothetical protein